MIMNDYEKVKIEINESITSDNFKEHLRKIIIIPMMNMNLILDILIWMSSMKRTVFQLMK